MFRDVLYTTLDVEVAGWIRSLQLRGIELPDDLKDEVFLIIGERRNIEVKRTMTGDVMDYYNIHSFNTPYWEVCWQALPVGLSVHIL